MICFNISIRLSWLLFNKFKFKRLKIRLFLCTFISTQNTEYIPFIYRVITRHFIILDVSALVAKSLFVVARYTVHIYTRAKPTRTSRDGRA
jgi:hypothetical protein